MRTRSIPPGCTRFVAVVAVAAMLMIGPLAALAFDAAVTPEVVAVACETAPIDELRYAEAAVDTGDDIAIPGPIPYEPPVGEAAPAAMVERMEALVGQVVACVNEGRTAAFLSLFTIAFLERHAAELGGQPGDTAPEPVAADMRLSLVRVADVTVLGDGRVAALVVFDQAEREAPELTSLLTFRELAGRLLIDEWQPVTLADAPHPGPCGGATSALDAVCDPTPTPVADMWEMVSGEGYTGVIVPLDRAPIFRIGYGNTASGWWLPNAEQIAELEASLPGYLLTFSFESIPSVADKIGTYQRQYAGLVVEGRALIFVNALCTDPTDGRWTSEPVVVDDGGDCFFQVYYDPSTGGFRELSINGEA